jgi:phospholipase/carboxylesterase
VELTHTHYEPPGPGPHPAILALHGWGASAVDLVTLAPWIAGGRLLVLCPQGPLAVPLPNGRGFGWFPLTGGRQLAAEGSIDDAVAAVRSFLARACARYPIDARRLVVLGFSQGGVLAYRLALAEPHRFAGLAALSSWLPPSLLRTIAPDDGHRALSTLVQHGGGDEVIAVARARQSVEALRELGVPVTYREYAMGHEIGPESLADLSRWLEERLLSPVTPA